MSKLLYVGLDVHKETISVTTAEEGRTGTICFIGTIPNTPGDHSAAHMPQYARLTPLKGLTGVIRRGSWLWWSVTGSVLCKAFQNASLNDLAETEITPLGKGLHWPRLDADKHNGC